MHIECVILGFEDFEVWVDKGCTLMLLNGSCDLWMFVIVIGKVRFMVNEFEFLWILAGCVLF